MYDFLAGIIASFFGVSSLPINALFLLLFWKSAQLRQSSTAVLVLIMAVLHLIFACTTIAELLLTFANAYSANSSSDINPTSTKLPGLYHLNCMQILLIIIHCDRISLLKRQQPTDTRLRCLIGSLTAIAGYALLSLVLLTAFNIQLTSTVVLTVVTMVSYALLRWTFAQCAEQPTVNGIGAAIVKFGPSAQELERQTLVTETRRMFFLLNYYLGGVVLPWVGVAVALLVSPDLIILTVCSLVAVTTNGLAAILHVWLYAYKHDAVWLTAQALLQSFHGDGGQTSPVEELDMQTPSTLHYVTVNPAQWLSMLNQTNLNSSIASVATTTSAVGEPDDEGQQSTTSHM